MQTFIAVYSLIAFCVAVLGWQYLEIELEESAPLVKDDAWFLRLATALAMGALWPLFVFLMVRKGLSND